MTPNPSERTYVGISGCPGAFCAVWRATEDPNRHSFEIEFHEDTTTDSANRWANKRMAQLRADPSVAMIRIGVVNAEFRRDNPMVVVNGG